MCFEWIEKRMCEETKNLLEKEPKEITSSTFSKAHQE